MIKRLLLPCAVLFLVAVQSTAAGEMKEAPQPTEQARKAAEEIRREALLPPRGEQGRPLPLASHWNVGTVNGTFEPRHQVELLQQGSHILPWMSWPSGDPEGERFLSYYRPLLQYCRELNLPLSFRGTQWEAMLVKEEYRDGPRDRWAGVITPDGDRRPVLSPFGAVEPWKDPAGRYVDTDAMRWVQDTYPDPPLVLWVSNNEAPKLRWKKNGPLEEKSGRYLDKYGRDRSDEFKRMVFARGWMERYPVMFDAMRRTLENETWRNNLRFVGYGAFGPAHLGRWGGWKTYSLVTDEWTAPDWHYWDGGSPSYYTNNWSPNRDYRVFSTQVSAMNWVFMLDEALEVDPDFWFEMSTWDGNGASAWMKGLGVQAPARLAEASSEGLPESRREKLKDEWVENSQALQYMLEGQDYPPERALGWLQFGMWLVRPRTVRQFYSHTTPYAAVEEYWLQVVRAVDRVHASETLEKFWRFGELVHNRAHRHPFRSELPEKYQNTHRWYLLDTDLDPQRPWDLDTELPVFSLALVRRTDSGRRWLLYAHSPLKVRRSVSITVPDYGEVTVDVPRGGAFYLIDGQTERLRRLRPGPRP